MSLASSIAREITNDPATAQLCMHTNKEANSLALQRRTQSDVEEGTTKIAEPLFGKTEELQNSQRRRECIADSSDHALNDSARAKPQRTVTKAKLIKQRTGAKPIFITVDLSEHLSRGSFECVVTSMDIFA